MISLKKLTLNGGKDSENYELMFVVSNHGEIKTFVWFQPAMFYKVFFRNFVSIVEITDNLQINDQYVARSLRKVNE
jgi:hypothetical protein